MQSYVWKPEFGEKLLQRLGEERQTIGPVRGNDGVIRLQPIFSWQKTEPDGLPLLPAKKFLLPSRDTLWKLNDGVYESPTPVPSIALVGLPPCDLHALSYLDDVFIDDPLYQTRRREMFLLGIACHEQEDCFCPPRTRPPTFDLFIDEERVWIGSNTGAAALRGLVDENSAAALAPPPCLTRGTGPIPPADLEQRFYNSSNLPLWQEVGARCLSCGACSSVCPTCYCYDVVDEALPGGQVTRLREWDNCFFHSHALVAGGHNFRQTRKERLRFRFEHKLLGFGALRGTSSCVGCGRCRRACPVDIDIADLLERLTGETS